MLLASCGCGKDPGEQEQIQILAEATVDWTTRTGQTRALVETTVGVFAIPPVLVLAVAVVVVPLETR